MRPSAHVTRVNAAVSLDRPVAVGDDRPGSRLAELLAALGGLHDDPLELVLLRERLAEVRARIPRLTDRARRSLTLVTGGARRAAVATELGGDEQQVDNALQRRGASSPRRALLAAPAPGVGPHLPAVEIQGE